MGTSFRRCLAPMLKVSVLSGRTRCSLKVPGLLDFHGLVSGRFRDPYACKVDNACLIEAA